MLFRMNKMVVCAASMPLLPCHAEIVTDGSLGPSASLSGPDYEIASDLGRRAGSNLFHSFGRFNLNAAESATFKGPTGIENLLARVTGGSASNIDGTISTQFENASPNLFFLNPTGIVFGPNAKLELQGSFHASTADFIRLGDGVRFNALPSGEDALLTTAPPEAFGFLGDQASIEVNDSFLAVPDGNTLSLVGGDITMKTGSVYAPGGQINLISTASPGEVTPTFSGLKTEGNVTSAQLGKIAISRDRNAARPNIEGIEISDVDAGGEVGGAIVIRGGQFVVENAFVQALTCEALTCEGNDGEKGAGIDIRVGTLDMRSLDQDIPALISTDTFGGADGGDVFVEADIMRLTGAGFCETCFLPTGILAQTLGEGDAGNIKVKARQMNVETGATVSTATFTQGKGGNLDIDADNIMLDGEGGFTTQSGLFPASAGNIDIKASSGLTLLNGAQVRTATFGPGKAGGISVQADRLFLSGSSPISGSSTISSETRGAGNAGEIKVTTKHLEVRDGADIRSATFGLGQGGNMSVTADDILLVGDPSILFTGLTNETQNEGNAGNLTVTANTLEIRDNARIEASTLFDQKTLADKFSGKGGDLTVTAGDIFISGRGAGIVAKSTNFNDEATSGHIQVTATDRMRLENGGKISVETVQADAGDISLDVGFLLHLRDSSITTSVVGGEGRGGNINIDPVFVVLDNSEIIANAFGGPGGNVHIVSDFLFQSPDSLIDASSEKGVQGTVEIDSPDTDVISSALELPESFLDVATLLTQGCAAGADLSRLVVRKYEVLPDSPAALRVPPPGGLLNADAPNDGVALIGEDPWPSAKHLSACDGIR